MSDSTYYSTSLSAFSLKEWGLRLSSLDRERLNILKLGIEATAIQGGEVWECGCWRGGTSLWMKGYLKEGEEHRAVYGGTPLVRSLRLFDTFAGLPHIPEQGDRHEQGTMKADYADVFKLFEEIEGCDIYQGVVPLSFVGLEGSIISVVHIDLDQYRGVKECLEWIYPRMHQGGWVVIDDYNDGQCKGVKVAVDEFVAQHGQRLFARSPQAHFIKT